jgi:ADP-dependent NAD(P)H-hydrate dehydratase / NAD(P)H-hydrate epimerase
VVPVLTAAEMREADRRTIEGIGLPGPVLMENAGVSVARLVRQRFPGKGRLAILCGKGNNGGDGLVAARRLADRRPDVVLFGTSGDVKGDARLHLEAYVRSGGAVYEAPDAGAWERVRERALFGAELAVDALLGTGLKEAPAGIVGQAIGDLGRFRETGRPIVAVDIPSGVPSDTGDVGWETVWATVTVTFAAPKYGHVLPPASDRCGELIVEDIGITPETVRAVNPSLWLLESADAARAFPPRAPGVHKGSFGHVLVIAGSVGKTGAAVLAATGALRAGAGLATVATAAPALPMVAAARPEIMTEPLPAGPAGGISREAVDRALSLAKARDAVVLGPGLGQEPSTRDFVREFVRRCPVPLVMDADGLNALAPSATLKLPGALEALRRDRPTVITPHPGEMARLAGASTAEVQARRLESARAMAHTTGSLVVLKGHRTVVAEPSGRAAVNPTGNPGMATGGTGDVLAGVLGALLAREEPWKATTASVFVHGRAGDLAARRRGETGLLAGDLTDALPEAIRALAEGGHS